VAWLDCRRIAVHEGGDHSILIGAALAGEESGGPPLLYYAGRYARLEG
jgi:flavin reductase (DIM6/NTAB) family NADH-FMN oxidoreductase RutF